MKYVKIYFRDGKISVVPNVVQMRVGDSLTWEIEAEQEGQLEATAGGASRMRQRLNFQIYFEGDSPFISFSPLTETIFPGTSGSIEAGEAIEKGDYKYGVRAQNSNTGELLDDEDPYIIVR